MSPWIASTLQATRTSAMLVATITLRLPVSGASNTRNCSSVDNPACKARSVNRGAARGSLMT
jgi:hypothetical protein